MIELKNCSACKKSLTLDNFPVNKQSKDGKYHKCKPCTKEYRENNREKIRDSRKRYYIDNADFVKAQVKKYITDNKEKVKIRKAIDYRKRHRRTMLTDAKRRARIKNVPFNIELEDIQIPEICPILGIPIIVGGQIGPSINSPSLDRKIPELGYVKGNIHVVSWRANRLKSDSTVPELEMILKYMKDGK
jgi:hypothetical protein